MGKRSAAISTFVITIAGRRKIFIRRTTAFLRCSKRVLINLTSAKILATPWKSARYLSDLLTGFIHEQEDYKARIPSLKPLLSFAMTMPPPSSPQNPSGRANRVGKSQSCTEAYHRSLSSSRLTRLFIIALVYLSHFVIECGYL